MNMKPEKTSGSSRMVKRRLIAAAAMAVGLFGMATSAPAFAQYRQEIRNDMGQCEAGAGPAVMVTVSGIKAGKGTLRIQSYKANAAEWLAKGKWLSRMELPARAGTMTVCVPVSGPGTYGIAIRHDLNGNGDTDIRTDGGGMSNNPAINIFNLGKPSYTKVGVPVGDGVKSIRIQMKYM